MLRQDVVDAVEAGQFHIYPIETIDQGIEMLTGIPAGDLVQDPEDEDAAVFAEGSLNRMVADRLAEMAKKQETKETSEEEDDREKKKRDVQPAPTDDDGDDLPDDLPGDLSDEGPDDPLPDEGLPHSAGRRTGT